MTRRRTTREVRYRCAVRGFLNRPGWHGRASVIAEVENTSRLHPDELRYPGRPHIHLSISDCSNNCQLEFSIDSRPAQRNSLYKINTLIAALERFREALEAEIELVNERSRAKGEDNDEWD